MESQITKNAIARIILTIDNKTNYASAITRETGMVYATVHIILKKLKQEKFIKFEKQGRQKFILLTNKGIKLKELLIEIKQL